MFRVFDKDGNGTISAADLRDGLGGTHLTDEEVDEIIRGFDFNDDGIIDYKEYAKTESAFHTRNKEKFREAVQKGKTDEVDRLLREGFDPNVCDSDG